jgi:cyclic pyranopterin phosphate synthase
MSSNSFTHIDHNRPHMVDVTDKENTRRIAVAQASVHLPVAVIEQLIECDFHLPKGPVFQTAILAGVMAAKKTADLIPLCHTLPIDNVEVNIELRHNNAIITSRVKTIGKTGVEMEALTAVSVAALTIYDMCKALSHDIVISEIQLLEKTGGKSDFQRHAQETR